MSAPSSPTSEGAVNPARARAAAAAAQPEQALTEYRAAVAALPADWATVVRYVEQLHEAGCAGLAETLAAEYRQRWRDLLTAYPESGWLRDQFSRFLLGSGDAIGALPLAREAVALDPQVADFACSLAEVEQALGNRAAAVEHLQRAFALDPGSKRLREQWRRIAGAGASPFPR